LLAALCGQPQPQALPAGLVQAARKPAARRLDDHLRRPKLRWAGAQL
jgi:hypothetical protein